MSKQTHLRGAILRLSGNIPLRANGGSGRAKRLDLPFPSYLLACRVSLTKGVVTAGVLAL
ncbi:MAG TPA: hypothetical protein VGX03_23680 [Candidatus Binatia bacterium]|nr:hypothetical protein [Candidatus Binatia bacterium]